MLVAVVALVAVEALPVKAPINVVAVSELLDGLNIRLVLTFSAVMTPLVALVKVKYLEALVVVSLVIVIPEAEALQLVVVPLVVKKAPALPV